MFREIGCHHIQHISDTQTGSCRDRHRIPDSQIIELVYIRHKLFKIIHLIDHQHHRFSGTPQHVRHLGVRILQPLAHICNENDHIRRVDGDLSLLPHLGEDHIPAVRLDSAGIDQGKFFIQPGDVRIDPVSCYSRRILYDGNHFSCQHIK